MVALLTTVFVGLAALVVDHGLAADTGLRAKNAADAPHSRPRSRRHAACRPRPRPTPAAKAYALANFGVSAAHGPSAYYVPAGGYTPLAGNRRASAGTRPESKSGGLCRAGPSSRPSSRASPAFPHQTGARPTRRPRTGRLDRSTACRARPDGSDRRRHRGLRGHRAANPRRSSTSGNSSNGPGGDRRHRGRDLLTPHVVRRKRPGAARPPSRAARPATRTSAFLYPPIPAGAPAAGRGPVPAGAIHLDPGTAPRSPPEASHLRHRPALTGTRRRWTSTTSRFSSTCGRATEVHLSRPAGESFGASSKAPVACTPTTPSPA